MQSGTGSPGRFCQSSSTVSPSARNVAETRASHWSARASSVTRALNRGGSHSSNSRSAAVSNEENGPDVVHDSPFYPAAQSSGHASPTGVLDIELSVERSRPQDSRAVPPPRRRERQERTDSGQAEQHGCAKSTARSPLGKAPAPRRTHDVALASKVGLAGICRHEPNAGVVRLAVRGSRAACWILAGRKPCVHIKQRPRELTTREASAFWRALLDLNQWPSDS